MTRPRWSSRATFLLAAIGSAVGLGNVWRFPYLTYKYGGGAFLVPYLAALLVIGIPLLMLEFAVGQKIQRGAIGTFETLHKGFGALGVFALLSAFIILCYYAVVMAWSLIYLFASLGVPWAGDSKAYFFNTVLQLSDNVGILGGINREIFFALLGIWVIIYFCVWKGVKSVGKIVWWTVPLPIFLLAVLMLRVVTLPGFLTGWFYYLKPDWSALLSTEVWIAAISQIFFTLTLAFGVMIAYASYKDEDEDVAKDSCITALANSAISIFAGFVVFGIIGYMATKTEISVADAATSGPGLAFVIFPEALSLMPWPEFFSVVFFLTLLSLGIDSAFSLVEAINAAILDDNNNWKTHILAFLVCCIAFLGGIIFTTRGGLYFLDIVDHFVTNYNLVIVGLLQCVLVGWIYGADEVRDFINRVSDLKIGVWWDIAIKFIIPAAFIILLSKQFWTEIHTPYEGYPGWALGIGWGVVALPFVIFVGMLIIGATRKTP